LWLLMIIFVRDVIIIAGALGYFLGDENSESDLLEPSLISKVNTVLQIALVLYLLIIQIYVGIDGFQDMVFIIVATSTALSGADYGLLWVKKFILQESLNSSMLLENFVANEELLRLINQLFLNQKSSELYIYGASGRGKTHVLQGAVLKSLADDKNALYIDCSDFLPEHLVDFIDQISLISFDNVHLIAKENEEIFFDLFNRARQSKVNILVSGDSLPVELRVMKDIKTRLSLTAVFKLEELNDELTVMVIDSQMIERNLKIDSKVYKYLFKNVSRDLKKLLSTLDDLDQASLQSKKPISIPFVREFLNLNNQ
jgi:DnaA family protein